jgi:hypothetical protein
MTPDESAEKVRRRMAELRRELECDVRQVSDSARIMTDWTFYVRRFPWAIAAIAAAAGFMLIPKRKQIIKPDPEMLAELVKKQQVKVQQVTQQTEKAGFVKPLVLAAFTWAARAGVNYIMEQVKTGALQKPGQSQQSQSPQTHPHESHSEHHQPSPSPLSEPWQ